MAETKKKFSKLMKPGESLATQFLETGNIGLDMAVSDGRGLPIGGVVTFYAAAGAGKTTTCVDVARRLLKKWNAADLPYKILYLDPEGSNNLMHNLGFEKFIENGSFLYQKDSLTFADLQEYCDGIIDGVDEMKDVKLIIIDSLQNIQCSRERKSDLEAGDFGDAVRYRNKFYKVYLPQLKKLGVTCMFVSQQRKKQAVMNPYENPNKSALTDGDKHYADVLLYFTKAADTKNTETKKHDVTLAATGTTMGLNDFFFINIKIDNDKNRYGVRGEVKTLVKYGYGCDNWWILHNLLQKYKHLKNKGSASSPKWVISDELDAYTGNTFVAECDKVAMKSWIRKNTSLIKDFLRSRDEYHNMPKEAEVDTETIDEE